MKKLNFIVAAFVLTVSSAFILKSSVNWKVKEDYSITLEGGSPPISFKGLKADIWVDEEKPEKSNISATIDTRTLKGGSDELTNHAKTELETTKYPTIKFVSTAITKTNAAGNYEAKGKLTIKDVTKEIKFPFFFNSQKPSDKFPFIDKRTFSGIITIMPNDFKCFHFKTGETINMKVTIPVTK